MIPTEALPAGSLLIQTCAVRLDEHESRLDVASISWTRDDSTIRASFTLPVTDEPGCMAVVRRLLSCASRVAFELTVKLEDGPRYALIHEVMAVKHASLANDHGALAVDVVLVKKETEP